jgi:uncharacterized protein (TIRG00374 family)
MAPRVRPHRIGNTFVKARLLPLLRVTISVILLVILLARIDAKQAFEVLRLGNPPKLLLAFGVYLVGVGVRAYRWQAFLNAQGFHLPLRRLTSLYLVGAFFNMFLPTGVGGDVIRMMELSRDGVDGTVSVSTVLADRVSGLLVLFAIALLSLPVTHRLATPQITAAIIALNLLSFGALFLLTHRSLLDGLAGRIRPISWLLERRQIGALYGSLASYRGRLLARSVLASLVFNGLLILTNVVIAAALTVDVDTGYFLLFVPLISFLLALPISLSGLGIREGGYVYLFGQAGVPPPAALSLSLSFYAVSVGTGLIGGIIYAVHSLRDLTEPD